MLPTEADGFDCSVSRSGRVKTRETIQTRRSEDSTIPSVWRIR
jgi:hypothetical protein